MHEVPDTRSHSFFGVMTVEDAHAKAIYMTHLFIYLLTFIFVQDERFNDGTDWKNDFASYQLKNPDFIQSDKLTI